MCTPRPCLDRAAPGCLRSPCCARCALHRSKGYTRARRITQAQAMQTKRGVGSLFAALPAATHVLGLGQRRDVHGRHAVQSALVDHAPARGGGLAGASDMHTSIVCSAATQRTGVSASARRGERARSMRGAATYASTTPTRRSASNPMRASMVDAMRCDRLSCSLAGGGKQGSVGV